MVSVRSSLNWSEANAQGWCPIPVLVLNFVLKTMLAVSYFFSEFLVLTPTDRPAEENDPVNTIKPRTGSV